MILHQHVSKISKVNCLKKKVELGISVSTYSLNSWENDPKLRKQLEILRQHEISTYAWPMFFFWDRNKLTYIDLYFFVQ